MKKHYRQPSKNSSILPITGLNSLGGRELSRLTLTQDLKLTQVMRGCGIKPRSTLSRRSLEKRNLLLPKRRSRFKKTKCLPWFEKMPRKKMRLFWIFKKMNLNQSPL